MHAKLLQSCLTLCNSMDHSPPGFSVHGFLQARILGWVAMPSSRWSSWLRDQTHSPVTPVLEGGLFITSATWEVTLLLLTLQSCPTVCNPTYGSPTTSHVPGILQARTLEWVAVSFSSAWKWKVKLKSLSRVWLLVTPWTAAYQALPSMGFSRQEY